MVWKGDDRTLGSTLCVLHGFRLHCFQATHRVAVKASPSLLHKYHGRTSAVKRLPTAKPQRCPASELDMPSETPGPAHSTDGRRPQPREPERPAGWMQNRGGPGNPVNRDEAWDLRTSPKTSRTYCIKSGASGSSRGRSWRGRWLRAACSRVLRSAEVGPGGRSSDFLREAGNPHVYVKSVGDKFKKKTLIGRSPPGPAQARNAHHSL